jgi:hypothetical protein
MGQKRKKQAKKPEPKKQIVESAKARLFFPTTQLMRAMSPFERRMWG